MATNGTAFEFFVGSKAAERGDVLIVPLISKPRPPLEIVSRVDAHCEDAVTELLEVGALQDDVGSLAHTTRGSGFRRVLVVSLGDAGKLGVHQVRTAAGSITRWLTSAKIAKASLWIDGLMSANVPSAVAEFTSAMVVAGYRFHEYFASKAPPKIRIQLLAADPSSVARSMESIKEHQLIADSVNYTRMIAHRPPNVINPGSLAAEARDLAKSSKLKCTIFDAAALKKQKMGGILGVGQGSDSPPCLIQLEYRAAPKSRVTTVIVGKAVTFDTGGYSIKPAENMEAMKFDKCGGMTVLGVMKAIAALKLKVNVVGLIPAAENSVSGRAYRPADILTMYSGKTVEVTNTDAEGRLILADALWYAQEKFAPTHLIDLATLTGGVRIALGSACAGLMSTNDELAGELGECGRVVHERLWRLPLWDDYQPLLKSTEADIKNSSGKREAHAIAGGMFLKEFIKEKTAWAHLDIAAVATNDENGVITGKGATAFGVRLLVEFLKRKSA